MIVAEPSNPWVSGVASLFSEEFYASIRRYLSDDGVFVQWLQLYEFNDDLAFSVLGALSRQFSDYVIYSTDDQDVMIIARKNGKLGSPDFSRILGGKLGAELRGVGIRDAADLDARYSGDKRLFDALLRAHPVPVNSDFFPYVDLHSAPARFKSQSASLLRAWGAGPLPVLEMLSESRVDPTRITPDESVYRLRLTAAALNLYDELVTGEKPRYAAAAPARVYAAATTIRLIAESCSIGRNETAWLLAWSNLSEATLPFLDSVRAARLVDWAYRPACATGSSPLVSRFMALYGAVARRDATAMTTTGIGILKSEATLDPGGFEYVLGAAMLGALAAGEPIEASSLWQGYGREHYAARPVPPNLEMLRNLGEGETAAPPAAASQPARATS